MRQSDIHMRKQIGPNGMSDKLEKSKKIDDAKMLDIIKRFLSTDFKLYDRGISHRMLSQPYH